MSQCVKQHLSNAQHYEQIDEHVAQECMNSSVNEFLNYMKEDTLKIPYEDYKHLHQGSNKITGISVFYCMPKVHKNKTSTSLRPVMSKVNNKLY